MAAVLTDNSNFHTTFSVINATDTTLWIGAVGDYAEVVSIQIDRFLICMDLGLQFECLAGTEVTNRISAKVPFLLLKQYTNQITESAS